MKTIDLKDESSEDHKTLQIETVKTDLFNIRQVLDMMDFLMERDSGRLTSYMPELKSFVLSLDKHTK